MLDLNHIMNDSRELVLEIMDSELTFSYFPNKFTNELLHRKLNEDSDEVQDVNFMLELMDKWDLLIDGEPAPLDYETCMKLPTVLLRAIVRAIAEDCTDDEEGKARRSTQQSGKPKEPQDRKPKTSRRS